MKLSVLLLMLFSFNISYAQSTQEQIDLEVWSAFTKAWESNDGEAFNTVHATDVWRINPGRLRIGEEYTSKNREQMNGEKKQRIIEFSFETRTANGDNAYEVGYYRITDTSHSETKYYVGRFHVALKKINDTWKITQDWDTDTINGAKITAKSLSNRTFIHFE